MIKKDANIKRIKIKTDAPEKAGASVFVSVCYIRVLNSFVLVAEIAQRKGLNVGVNKPVDVSVHYGVDV